MIVMKFDGTSVQDAQAIDRVAAIVRERLQLEIFLSPKLRPATRQVSGHEFTRALQPRNNPGFSPCEKGSQGLKANPFRPFTARLKSFPDTCLSRGRQLVVPALMIVKKLPASHSPSFNRPSFLRASVPPWWVFSGVPS